MSDRAVIKPITLLPCKYNDHIFIPNHGPVLPCTFLIHILFFERENPQSMNELECIKGRTREGAMGYAKGRESRDGEKEKSRLDGKKRNQEMGSHCRQN